MYMTLVSAKNRVLPTPRVINKKYKGVKLHSKIRYGEPVEGLTKIFCTMFVIKTLL